MYANFYAVPEMVLQIGFRAAFVGRLKSILLTSPPTRTVRKHTTTHFCSWIRCFIFTRIQAAAISSAVSWSPIFSSTSVWSSSTETFFSLRAGIMITTLTSVHRNCRVAFDFPGRDGTQLSLRRQPSLHGLEFGCFLRCKLAISYRLRLPSGSSLQRYPCSVKSGLP